MYTLTIDNKISKEYSTLESAIAVYDRLIGLVRAKQAKYDTCQMVEYIAIDSETEMDLVYCDGSKLMDSVMRLGK